MTTSVVSSKYQIVIPKRVRKKFPIHPQQRVNILVVNGVLEIIPEKSAKDFQGFLPSFPSKKKWMSELREKDA